ncbi:hypothetical protein Bca4012_056508 [Brassica carinata]
MIPRWGGSFGRGRARLPSLATPMIAKSFYHRRLPDSPPITVISFHGILLTPMKDAFHLNRAYLIKRPLFTGINAEESRVRLKQNHLLNCSTMPTLLDLL